MPLSGKLLSTIRTLASPAGHLLESTDPLGQTIRYKTDPLGRILEKILPGLPGTDQKQTESFQYDANGNLIGCANGELQISRKFDLEGKLIEEQQGPDCQITYQYDLNGNRTSRTTTIKNGTTTRSHTVNYAYDSLGQAATIAIGDHQPVQFTRNAGGQIIREVLGSHLKRWLEYDESGYLTRQTVAANTGPLFEQEYSYDRTGNLIKKVDSVFGTDKYYYDTMGRINRQIDPLGQVQKFLYDPAGDRLVTRVEESAEDKDQTDWSRIGECDRTTYRFNRAGNLVSRTSSQETAEFIWDANQRLVASIKDGQETTYGYDPLGRRISKETEGVVTRFYWDGDALLGDITDEQWREWIYYPGSFEPLAMVATDFQDKDIPQAERIYYYANDPNGCPTRLLDETGKVVWAARYDAWGGIRKLVANEVDQPLRLQGQYFDAETGLCYNRFRYYCPEIGSFISQDPLGLVPGENVYAFGPNVHRWIDPLGLCKEGTPKTVAYSPANPGPLKQSVAETFSGATYKETVLTQDTTFYRVYGGSSGKVGSYMTRVPQNGGMQSQVDLALNPQWGNTAQYVTKVTVPKGTVIYEGTAAPQVINGGAGQLIGGGNQVYIPEVDASWFK